MSPTEQPAHCQVEITEIPPLQPGEQSVLDFHSVINVLNVLLCEDMLRMMSDHEAALRHVVYVDDSECQMMAEIKGQLATASTDPVQLADSLENLHSAFTILKQLPFS